MGYELDKLLKQYGVSSAFTPTYTGTAKPAAGEVGPSQYTTDKALFDKYKASYQERMGSTPMYADAQFQTQAPAAAPTSVQDLYKTYLGRTVDLEHPQDYEGLQFWNEKFYGDKNYSPTFSQDRVAPTQAQIKEFVNAAKPELAGRAFGNQALMDLTGSYYGGQLQAPTYANYTTPNTVTDSGLTLSTADGTSTTGGTSTTANTASKLKPASESWKGSLGAYGQWLDPQGAAVPWYLNPANSRNPDAAKAAALEGIELDPNAGLYASTYAGPQGPKPGWNPMADIAQREKNAMEEAAAENRPYIYGQATGAIPFHLSSDGYTSTYARGGKVKTHYYRGDRVELPEGYDMDGTELAAIDTIDNPMNYQSDADMREKAAAATKARIEQYLSAEPPGVTEAPASNIQLETVPTSVAPTVVAPTEITPAKPVRVTAPGALNLPPDLAEMLSKYTGGESVYGTELAGARSRAETEAKSFNDMLEKALAGTKEEAPSKAEMYFRLAAAFGKPTKTGHFTESLGNVGEVLGEQAKEERAQRKAERALKLQLGLEGQKARMAAAKEDVTALRGLAGEEMKDKRAIATELLKQHIASGEPKSSAGKQAQDEGLKPGTPEFKERVAKISELNIEKANANINAALAGMSVQQANLALQQNKFGFQQQEAAKLTPGELKLRVETEDIVAQTDQALKDLKRAYELNPNTFDSSLVDVAQRKLLESAGSKDAKVIATREQENLLQKAALSQLKSTFPGAISNDERKALQDVQGIGSKSKEERAVIMRNAYNALKAVNERHRKRVNEIKQGLYRDTTPSTGELE